MVKAPGDGSDHVARQTWNIDIYLFVLFRLEIFLLQYTKNMEVR